MSHESFSGETPYAICEQYAAGKIDRSQLVNQLTRWKYVPQDRTTDYFDDLLFEVPGSVDDLNRALRHGLIDDELYDEVADRLEALHGEVDPEKRWPKLFELLPDDARSEAIAACWRAQSDAGYPLSHRDVQHITSLVVDDPERFAMLYGPYMPVDETTYAELAERAERGELRVKPGTERHGEEASPSMALSQDCGRVIAATEMQEQARALAEETGPIPPTESGVLIARLGATVGHLARVAQQLEEWHQQVVDDVHFRGDGTGAYEASQALDEVAQLLREASDKAERARVHNDKVRWNIDRQYTPTKSSED